MVDCQMEHPLPHQVCRILLTTFDGTIDLLPHATGVGTNHQVFPCNMVHTHTFHASLSMPQKRTLLYRLYSQGNLANALTCSMVVQRIWIRLVFHFKTFSISSLEYHPISKSLTVLSFFVRDFSLNLMNASWIRLALDLFGLLIWVARPTWRVNWQICNE